MYADGLKVEEGTTLSPEEIENYTVPRDRELYITHILSEIAEDIERTVHFCKSQEQRSDIHINRIILVGFGLWPRNLAEMLTDKLRIPVVTANPFGYDTAVLSNAQPNEVCETPSDYAAAFGLALEGLGE